MSIKSITNDLRQLKIDLDDAQENSDTARIMLNHNQNNIASIYVEKHRECIDSFNEMRYWFMSKKPYQI